MGIRGIGSISKYNFKKETIIVILAAVCVLGFTQNAYGDNLIGNLGSATVNVGDSVTNSIKLQETSANNPGSDPINGCNADGFPVEFQINYPAGMVTGPATVIFDHCSNSDRQDVVYTALMPGIHTITITYSEGGTFGGAYQTQPATTVLTVLGDVTPPIIAPHDDEIHEATSAAGADVSYTPPATSDNVDPPGIATCLPAPGSTFALGDTTVICNASDAAGNVAIPTTFTITVRDTIPPVTTIDSAIDIFNQVITLDSIHPRHSAEFTFSGTDIVTAEADLTYECSFDGSPFSSCTSPQSFIRLPDGPHTFSVAAIDAAGNRDPVQFNWTIDTASVAATLSLDQNTYPTTSNVWITISDYSNLTPTIEVTLTNA